MIRKYYEGSITHGIILFVLTTEIIDTLAQGPSTSVFCVFHQRPNFDLEEHDKCQLLAGLKLELSMV